MGELGPSIEEIVELGLPQPSEEGDRLAGVVLDVDRFGNLITNVRQRDLAGRMVQRIEIGSACIDGLSTWYDPDRPIVALIDSDGWLEVAAPLESAAERLGVGVNAPVVVCLEPPSKKRGAAQ